MQGNVSTYRLNSNDIVKMMQGQVMPPSSSILAATIGVTFVSPKNLPQKTMPGFLRVNHNRVHRALRWLKANNPLYREIVILLDRLNELPSDGIPVKISSLAHRSDDVELLADKNDGYVPDENTVKEGWFCYRLIFSCC
jgi:hypothetical protein